jgi:hypothetical protein
MKPKSWAQVLAAAAGVVIALSGAAAQGLAAVTLERPPAPGSRTYANAVVAAIDARAGRITVRGGAVGKDETFQVEGQARHRVGELKPGDEVVLTLCAAGLGREVVTAIERSVAGRPAERATASRAPRRRRGSTAAPAPITPTPAPAPSPAADPVPSPEPPRLPTDIVGPLRDPRVDPNFDPRLYPLRNPHIIPGLSEPAPIPSPTPSPSAGGLSSDPQLVAP